MKKIMTSLVLLLLCSNLRAERQSFLAQGPGAEIQAMGGSAVARGVDATAGFYNPATLPNAADSVLVEYSQPNEGAHRSWVGADYGSSDFKAGIIYNNEVLPLASNKNAILLAAGFRIPGTGLSFGLMGGYLTEKIITYSADSTIGSAGLAYNQTYSKGSWGLGAVAQNALQPSIQWRPGIESEVWPVIPEAGGYIDIGKFTLTSSASMQRIVHFSGGMEYRFVDWFRFRAGSSDDQPRIGFGSQIGDHFKIDYALMLAEIQNVHQITLSWKF